MSREKERGDDKGNVRDSSEDEKDFKNIEKTKPFLLWKDIIL